MPSQPAEINILFKECLELAHLGLNHCSAVPLIGVQIVIVLVILLRNIELIKLLHFCHYLCRVTWVLTLLRYLLQDLPNRLMLLLVPFLVEDNGSVLCAGVVALPVERSWVMDVHEDVE